VGVWLTQKKPKKILDIFRENGYNFSNAKALFGAINEPKRLRFLYEKWHIFFTKKGTF